MLRTTAPLTRRDEPHSRARTGKRRVASSACCGTTAKSYDVAVSLGQAELNLGLYRDAAEHLAFGTRNVPPREDPVVANRSAEALEYAKQRIGTVVVSVQPKGALIRLNGQSVGSAPLDAELFVEPGKYTVDASLAGYQSAFQEFRVNAGEMRSIQFQLVPVLEAAPKPAPNAEPLASKSPATEDAKPENAFGTREWLGLGGLAVTGIAATATLVFALEASDASDREESLRTEANKAGAGPCSPPLAAPSQTCSSLERAVDDRISANRTTSVFLALTGVAALSTAALYLAWPESGKAERPSATVSVNPHGAGLELNGRF